MHLLPRGVHLVLVRGGGGVVYGHGGLLIIVGTSDVVVHARSGDGSIVCCVFPREYSRVICGCVLVGGGVVGPSL